MTEENEEKKEEQAQVPEIIDATEVSEQRIETAETGEAADENQTTTESEADEMEVALLEADGSFVEEPAEATIWEKLVAKLTTTTGKMLITGVVFLSIGLAGGYYWGSHQPNTEQSENFMGMERNRMNPYINDEEIIDEMPAERYFY